MNTLIIIRHPDYNNNGDLYPSSKEKFSNLFDRIVKHLELGSTLILTSPLPRAAQTTSIVKSFCSEDTPVVNMPELAQQDQPTCEDYEKIFKKIKEFMSETDTIIISTHGEYTGGLLEYTLDRLNERVLREKYYIGTSIDKGQVIISDLEKNKTTVFGPTEDKSFEW